LAKRPSWLATVGSETTSWGFLTEEMNLDADKVGIWTLTVFLDVFPSFGFRVIKAIKNNVNLF